MIAMLGSGEYIVREMLAKSVWIPKTALKRSAWTPVFAAPVSAAVRAVWQVALAVASAPHEFVRVSQMN